MRLPSLWLRHHLSFEPSYLFRLLPMHYCHTNIDPVFQELLSLLSFFHLAFCIALGCRILKVGVSVNFDLTMHGQQVFFNKKKVKMTPKQRLSVKVRLKDAMVSEFSTYSYVSCESSLGSTKLSSNFYPHRQRPDRQTDRHRIYVIT